MQRRTVIAFQVLSLLLLLAAVMWGTIAVLAILFPGSSGEWAGLPVYFAAIVNLPVGAALLALNWYMRSGAPRLRWACMILSLASLLLPIVAHLLWRFRAHF